MMNPLKTTNVSAGTLLAIRVCLKNTLVLTFLGIMTWSLLITSTQALTFGVNDGQAVRLDNGAPYITSAVTQELAYSGVSTLRIQMNLVGTQTSWTANNNQMLNYYDAVVNSAIQSNISVMIVISYSAMPVNGLTQEQNQAQWIANNYEHTPGGNGDNPWIDNFVSQAVVPIVAHFKDRVKVFEIWNEPNLPAGTTTAGTNDPNVETATYRNGSSYMYPSNYSQMLSKSWLAVHEQQNGDGTVQYINPDIKVISSLACIGTSIGALVSGQPNPNDNTTSGAIYVHYLYYMGLYLNNCWNYVTSTYGTYPVDGIGQHPYFDRGGAAQAADLTRALTLVRDAYVAFEGTNTLKQTYVTEIGWATKPPVPPATTPPANNVIEALQATNTTTACTVLSQTSYIAMAIFYDWKGDGGSYFGLSNVSDTPSSPSPKPVLDAFRAANGLSPFGTVAVANSSFEAPAVANWMKNPTGGSWSFTGNSGIAHNSGSIGAPTTPDGVQAAFLANSSAGNGTISQTTYFPVAGTYTVSLNAAKGTVYAGQPFNVTVNGTTVGTITASATSYTSFTTNTFTISTPGNYPVAFTGTATTGNAFVFIDSVSVQQSTSTSTVANNSFELPAVGNWLKGPTGASWIFTGNSGIAHNGSALGSPTAPDGVQTAYLAETSAGNGTISQTIYFPTAGTYTVSMETAKGTVYPGQSFNVTVNGTTVGTFTAPATSFTSFTTNTFAIATPGNYSVAFAGTATSGNDYVFIDSVSIQQSDSDSTVPNSSFELPAVGNWLKNPTGGAWTFTGNSGIAHNGSSIGSPDAPDGVQAAFLEETSTGNGTISQSVYFPLAGTYTVAVAAAKGTDYPGQPFNVIVNGTTVGTFTPTTTTYTSFATSSFIVAAPGYYTISLAGTATSGNDFIFIDSVSIQ